ncbi:Annexin, partial [Lepidopterella palustris CBS 459.81]
MGEGERQIVFSAPDDLDPEEDAIVLAKSLSQITPDTKILVDILPRLSHAQMMQIRTEYKRFVRVKINDEGDTRGVNLAKHIKLRCTDEFGKICYVTALGCWESDAYWANTPFQPTSCRNELLIEALIARSNYEIENIIAAFRNKQYSNSLAKCLDHELENGSQILRRAVVLALEGKRQEASDERPVGDDVDICRGALHDGTVKSTTLLDMLMTRSESHIRKLLKEYETRFNEHFAKAAVKKWPDMLGEILAHIFNAAINRPARDAILIHHSLEEFSHEPTAKEPRYELLISRLVRLHWESPRYMHYVKNEYQHKFGHSIMEAIKNMTKDDFCSFCLAL